MHWSPGPVFRYEWVAQSRRWQLFALRAGLIAALLGCFFLGWLTMRAQTYPSAIRAMADLGNTLFIGLIGTQLAIVLFAAPASTAGAICEDRASGLLRHLLVTDLTDAEVILGKYASRLLTVLSLVTCSLPVMFLAVLLGGISAEGLIGAYLVTIAMAILGCALGLALSVSAVRTHDVFLNALFIQVMFLWLLPGTCGMLPWIWPLTPSWVYRLRLANPFTMTLETRFDPSLQAVVPQLIFFAGAVGVSAALLAWAILRVRPATLQQANRATHRRRTFFWSRDRLKGRWSRRLLDWNPVLWHEWWRRLPSPWSRAVWGMYQLAGLALCSMAYDFNYRLLGRHVWSILERFWYRVGETQIIGCYLLVGFLLLSILSVIGLAEDRNSGSLHLLLATPLSTRMIVWGKWWSSFRLVLVMAFWAVLFSLPHVWRHVFLEAPIYVFLAVIACGSAFGTLGLALAIWISRTSRAVVVSICLCALLVVGWWLIIQFRTDNWMWRGNLLNGSALALVTLAMKEMSMHYQRVPGVPGDHVLWKDGLTFLFWIYCYFTAAAILFWAIDKTIRPCLGRIQPRSEKKQPLSDGRGRGHRNLARVSIEGTIQA